METTYKTIKLFCARCKNSIGYAEGKGIFQIGCHVCRSLNVFRSEKGVIGMVLRPENDDTFPIVCKHCRRIVGRHLEKYGYQVKCQYCKKEFRAGFFGEYLKEQQMHPENRERRKLIPTR